MSLTRVVVLGVLAAAAMGCSKSDDGNARPLILAASRDTGDPAVVAVTRSAGYICTGTLIAPRYVLTAAHCVPSPLDGGRGTVSVSLRASGVFAGPRLEVARVHLPDTRTRGEMDDIAVIELAKPVDIQPAALNLAPLSPDSVQDLRIVGYGMAASHVEGPPVKRVGTAQAHLLPSYVETIAGTGGPCDGDSGGPAFATIDGKEVVVGVSSLIMAAERGACDAAARYVRTDRERTFLAPFVGADSNGPEGAGSEHSVATNDRAPPPPPVNPASPTSAANPVSPANPAGPTWDGRSTLTCDGNDELRLTGVVASVSGTAIRARGSCHVRLVGVQLTADTVIDAGDDARVTITGGTLRGAKDAIVAAKDARVELTGTVVTGAQERSGGARITGLGVVVAMLDR